MFAALTPSSRLKIATWCVFVWALTPFPGRCFVFLDLWSDPSTIAQAGHFPTDELMHLVWIVIDVGAATPILLIACLGLSARKLWGAWTAMTGLGILFARFLAIFATAIILRQAGISASHDYYNITAWNLILGTSALVAYGATAWLLWSSRELLE